MAGASEEAWKDDAQVYALALCNAEMENLIHYVCISHDIHRRLVEHLTPGADDPVRHLLDKPGLGLDARFHLL
jgi:hypothetical protein